MILGKPNIDNGEWMLPASSDTPRQSIDPDNHTPFFTKKHEVVFALALMSEFGAGDILSPLAPASNHVETDNGNHLPAGVHELYNDAAVVWKPMSQVHVHYQRNPYYFAW